MGQALVAPKLNHGVGEFINLPTEAIESLWTSFNLYGEGWCLSYEEFKSIFEGAKYLKSAYHYPDAKLAELFKVFDTDSNGLIDAMEMLITVALLSGMDSTDKLYFAFNAFDFDRTGTLSFDETNLLLRTIVKGLGKISSSSLVFTSPTNKVIESYAELLFKKVGGSRISANQYENFCSSHPILSSWLKCLSSFPPNDAAASENDPESDSKSKIPVAPAIKRISTSIVQPSKSLGGITLMAPTIRKAYSAASAATAMSEEERSLLNDVILLANTPPPPKPIKKEKVEDEEEEEISEEEKNRLAAEKEKSKEAEKIKLPAWLKKVDLLKPEELPPIRTDLPEDVIEPLWICGVNTLNTAAKSSVPFKRCVRYGLMIELPVSEEEAPAEDENGQPIIPPNPHREMVYTISNHLVCMRNKNLPTYEVPSPPANWLQKVSTEHTSSITCFDVCVMEKDESNPARGVIATGDSTNKVVLWDAKSFSVLRSIDVSCGVKFLDISSNGKLVLVVLSDSLFTSYIFEVQSGMEVFSKPLINESELAEGHCIYDVRFSRSTSRFVVAGSMGVKFFVEESVSSLLGPGSLRVFEEKLGLYQGANGISGSDVVSICLLDNADEVVTSTNKGQLMLWKGRSCIQIISNAHKSAIHALDYNPTTKTLISGGEDGSVNLYRIAGDDPVASESLATASYNKKLTKQKGGAQRGFEITSSFDILGNKLLNNHNILSIALFPADSSKALICTAGCDVCEISCKIGGVAPPTEESDPAATSGEDGEETDGTAGIPVAPKSTLGVDVNGGPVTQSHVLVSTYGRRVAHAAICKVPVGSTAPSVSFATSGADGSIKLWQTSSEGSDEGNTNGNGVTAGCKVVKQLMADSSCGAGLDASSSLLALSLDGTHGNTARQGAVHIFSLAELKFITQLKDSSEPMSSIKFSPDGTNLAVASCNGTIFVYQQQTVVTEATGEEAATESTKWSLKGKLSAVSNGSSRMRLSIDFSMDGQYLRCFYQPINEFKVFSVGSEVFGKDMTDTSALPVAVVNEEDEGAGAVTTDPTAEILKGLSWASNSCPINWDTKGAKALLLLDPVPIDVSEEGIASSPEVMPVLSIQSVDRSQHLLVSALSDGCIAVDRLPAISYTPYVKLARFESAKNGKTALISGAYVKDSSHTVHKSKYENVSSLLIRSSLKTITAHLGSVGGTIFIEDGNKMVTVGESDGAIRIWKVTYDLEEPEVEPEDEVVEVEEPEAEEEEFDDEGNKKPKAVVLYDSAEEEDFYDTHRMKQHLLRTEPPLMDGDEDLSSNPLYSGTNAWTSSIGLQTPKETSATLRKLFAMTSTPCLLPNDELEMNWVYGCSARQTRNSVRYAADGRIIYPAGMIGVMYDKLTHGQQFIMPHADEITCLDMHLPSKRAVSAHKGAGCIFTCIWSTETGKIEKKIPCGSVNGISAISFTNDGLFFTVACQDSAHTILVFSTVDGRIISNCSGGSKKVLCLSISAANATALSESEYPLRMLQGGVGHFNLLSFYPSRSILTSKIGGYGSGVKKSSVMCAAAIPLQPAAEGDEATGGWVGNEFILGMSDGSVGIISRGENKVSAFTAIQKGSVTAICVLKTKDGSLDEPPGYKIVLGGVGGFIRVLDNELQPILEVDMFTAKDYGLHPLGRLRGFKSLCVDKLNRKILYATSSNEIGEVDIETGADMNYIFPDKVIPASTDSTTPASPTKKGPSAEIDSDPAAAPFIEGVPSALPPRPKVGSPLISAHFRDELHSLCAHPLRQECLSAGDDKTLRIWDLQNRSLFTKIDLPDIARCAAFSPNGLLIAVGLGGEVNGIGRPKPRTFNGRVVIVSYLQGQLRTIHVAHNATGKINSIGFSPDGSKLYAASQDTKIYVYNVLNNFVLLATLAAHTQAITHIDISSDGRYVVSTGVRGEMYVWDTPSSSAIYSPGDKFETLANIGLDYTVRQSPCGINSLGVFKPSCNVFDIASLNQSNDRKLLVTGELDGSLKLFSNPACDFFAPHKRYTGHSPGGISKVSFTFEDQLVLTTGKSDRSIIQWKVIRSDVDPDKPAAAIVETDEKVVADVADQFITTFPTGLQPPNPNDKATDIQFNLKSMVGVGQNFLKSSTVPTLQPIGLICGKGEILTIAGKVPLLLHLGDGALPLQQPMMLQNDVENGYSSLCSGVINAVAVSPTGRLLAIGYTTLAGMEKLTLISCSSTQIICELSENMLSKVASISFSIDSKMLACTTRDAQHSLHVFRSYSGLWNDDAELLFSGQNNAANTSLVSFLNSENEDFETYYDIITAGQGTTKFWKIAGSNIHSTCGIILNESDDSTLPASFAESVTVVVSAVKSGIAITGDVEGKIYYWKSNIRRSMVGQHNTGLGQQPFPISALKTYSGSDSNVVAGSADGVKLWDYVNCCLLWEFSTFQILTGIQQGSTNIYLSTLGGNNSSSEGALVSNYVTNISTDAECKKVVISFSSSPIVSLFTDSGTVQRISEGHRQQVLAIAAHATDPNIVVTVSTDRYLRLWDIAAYTMQGFDKEIIRTSSSHHTTGAQLVGSILLSHPATSVSFINDRCLLVGADTGAISSSVVILTVTDNRLEKLQNSAMETASGSSAYSAFYLSIVGRIHNIGTGEIHQVKVCPNNYYLAVSSSDGYVYMFKLPKDEVNYANPAAFIPLGVLQVHTDGEPVVGVDFVTKSRYLRAFGKNNASTKGKIGVSYFDLEKAAGAQGGDENQGPSSTKKLMTRKVVDVNEIKSMEAFDYTSVSSAGAPNLKNVSYLNASEPLVVASIAKNAKQNEFVCVGYEDGLIRIFKAPSPGCEVSTVHQVISVHGYGPVLTTFTAPLIPTVGSKPLKTKTSAKMQQFVSVGKMDGVIMVWNVWPTEG